MSHSRKNLKSRLLLVLLFTAIGNYSVCAQARKASTTRSEALKNKKIVVTAPLIYGERLKNSLEKYGAEVTLMPIIETIVYDSIPGLSDLNHTVRPNAAFQNKYDFIVLPSRNAIKAFDNEMHLHYSGQIPFHGEYYVLGRDMQYLNALGYSTPNDVDDPSMMGILEFIGQHKDFSNKHLLLIAPKVTLKNEPNVVPDFVRQAESMGIHCHQLFGYTTQAVNNQHTQHILTRIEQGKYDMIAFSSAGELFALAECCNPSKLQCAIACFGPYTASNASKAGIQVDMVSKKYHSFDDYAESIAEYFEAQ